MLAVHPTEDSTRVLLRVTRLYPDELLLEGIVARSELAGTLKAELRRFFAQEFDPGHWDDEEGCLPTKARLQQSRWFAALTADGAEG
ncbi:hypothetical protein [Halopseudomonas aestusnigri]|uniref:hypothetical protein n=1 Tax=Halopseudomonas aestusnigri TaxID=857252 RepID=UPI000C43CD1C|nr:hypothetical protein [Pseudomonas sp.]MAP77960.1 hypothetical protein [Pseudomonadales bacterium]MAY07200.1 hypothetical protein [Pseudomonadales bacterium]